MQNAIGYLRQHMYSLIALVQPGVKEHTSIENLNEKNLISIHGFPLFVGYHNKLPA
jgi:hypothetical protein